MHKPFYKYFSLKLSTIINIKSDIRTHFIINTKFKIYMQNPKD